MEQRYWEQFMKTGGVCDYLGYKMEAYGHGRGRDGGQEKAQAAGSTGFCMDRTMTGHEDARQGREF